MKNVYKDEGTISEQMLATQVSEFTPEEIKIVLRNISTDEIFRELVSRFHVLEGFKSGVFSTMAEYEKGQGNG